MALQIERILDSRFEFSLDGGDPISDNAPNLTTFGNVCHFKTKSGANIIREQNITYADITVIDTFGGTGSFTFVNIQSLWVKLIDLNFFVGAAGVGGGGSTTFAGLNDTDAYFGNDGKIPIVNENELKLDYVTFYNYNKFTQLDDVEVATLIDGKIIGVTLVSGQPKITLVDKPADGETYFSAVGGFDYNDLDTQTTPLNYITGDLQLTNDTLGAFTFLTQPPFGITSVWDETTNTFDFSELSIGDEVFIRIHINLTTTSANQVSGLKMLFGEGTLNEFNQPIDLEMDYKTAGSHDVVRDFRFYIGNEDWRTTPAKLLFESDASATIVINGWHPYIIRKSINILDVEVKGGSEKPAYVIASQDQTMISIDSSVNNIDVWVNRVYQIEGLDYNRNLNDFTFTYNLDLDDIVCYRTHTVESVKEAFLATNGQLSVTLSNSPRTTDVWVNRVMQIEGIDYNKSDNIITFTNSLDINDYIIVRKHR